MHLQEKMLLKGNRAKMEKLKVLVFSTSAISDSESNGRVLKSLLPDCSECQYLNIYISGIPAANCNITYHHFSDKSVIKSFLSFGILPNEDIASFEDVVESKHEVNNKTFKKKTAAHYFLRDFIWNLSLKTKKKIREYSRLFKPDVIFLMGANFPLFYKLSAAIAKELSAALIVYTAEDYPIKKYNYIVGKSGSSFFYKLVRKNLYKQASLAYHVSSLNIFNTQKLLDSYRDDDLVVDNNSLVIKIPSSLSPLKSLGDSKEILYAGNLYNDRCKSLIEVADCLSTLKTDYKLVVYGNVFNKHNLDLISNHESIVYKGVVSFAELKARFNNVSFLLHVDGFDEYSLLDYRHAFSTKIADYLILGIPFICYGSLGIAGVEYLYNLNKDFTIVSKETLYEKLAKILSHTINYKIDNVKINRDFSMFECRKRMLTLFKQVEREDKI